MLREAKPIFCYVTDRRALAAGEELPGVIGSGVSAGVDWIQLREKDLPARRLAKLARAAMAAAQGSGTRILVNDRLDVALATGAAGVHLGEESLPADTVTRWRKSTGRAEFLVGVSCHSLAAATEAERGGASYLFFGPIFPTPSKAAYGPPQGLERLAEICQRVRIPVLAIGGITLENAAACLAAGAAGVAAIRLFQESADLAEVVRRLRSGA